MKLKLELQKREPELFQEVKVEGLKKKVKERVEELALDMNRIVDMRSRQAEDQSDLVWMAELFLAEIYLGQQVRVVPSHHASPSRSIMRLILSRVSVPCFLTLRSVIRLGGYHHHHQARQDLLGGTIRVAVVMTTMTMVQEVVTQQKRPYHSLP